jgi:SAM-dependent methyltransferase
MSEAEKIHARYARRTRTYEPWEPWVHRTHQELERRLVDTLRRAKMLPAGNRCLLEVGCGGGNNLLTFLRLGFSPERLVGSELQEERAAAARARVPSSVAVLSGDSAGLPLPDASFDIVFQSLVFSSILDPAMRVALADRMWRLTAPGGGVLWYDFTWNNPANPDVAGVTLAGVRKLFPHGTFSCTRVTLAPPLSRWVTRLHPALYDWCNVLSPLRTHILCWISKPRSVGVGSHYID